MKRMICILATLSLTVSAQEPRELERRSVPGTRVRLPTGELFVPAGVRPHEGRIDLIVHLHGAAWVVQQALVESKVKAVLVSVAYKGLSSAYDRPFRDAKLFGAILSDARSKLARQKGFEKVRWKRVVLSSFSAGYGGVRRILSHAPYVKLIDAVILADSLHAGYGAARRPREQQMIAFRGWAALAASKRKLLWLTHSAVKPPDYASTTETADDLIRAVGAKRRAASSTNEWGMRLATVVDQGGFHVRGYAGVTGKDHMRHLWFLATPFRELFARMK